MKMKLFLSICGSFVVLELILSIFWWNKSFVNSYEDEIGPTAVDQALVRKKVEQSYHDVKRHLTAANNQPKMAHPYFGYVYNHMKDPESINRDGFYSKVHFSQYKKDDHNFVIGVFGGSVAKSLANYLIKTQKKKHMSPLKRLEDITGKKVVIFNFGVSAYRQPQQFLTYSFFADKLDLSINLDGYNEIMYRPSAQFMDWYPHYHKLFYRYNFEDYENLAQAYKYVTTSRDYTNFIMSHSWLSHSGLIHLSWLALQKRREGIFSKLNPEGEKNNLFPENNYKQREERLERAFAIWRDFTVKQLNLAKAHNKPALFFIQPNQYYLDSKVYSKEEKSKYLVNRREKSKVITAGYDLMSNFSLSYKEVMSLKDLYKSTTETVYKDNCCHLNERGNSIMTRKIIDEVVKALGK